MRVGEKIETLRWVGRSRFPQDTNLLLQTAKCRFSFTHLSCQSTSLSDCQEDIDHRVGVGFAKVFHAANAPIAKSVLTSLLLSRMLFWRVERSVYTTSNSSILFYLSSSDKMKSLVLWYLFAVVILLSQTSLLKRI